MTARRGVGGGGPGQKSIFDSMHTGGAPTTPDRFHTIRRVSFIAINRRLGSSAAVDVSRITGKKRRDGSGGESSSPRELARVQVESRKRSSRIRTSRNLT